MVPPADYKATLNLPKSAFPMKGNLPATEPAILGRWEAQGLYEKILARRQGAPAFILHDGPPYANGDIHMGHALNKTLKDFIVRFENLKGRRAPYLPGWDCHGLPIEYALMRELAVTKHEVDTVEFRRKAREYAKKFVGIQREQFKRLGAMGQWEDPYLTLAPGYVQAALTVLKRLTEEGFVYRDRRPVNWCWSCETALAEAEVEYEKHASPSVYVKFPLTAESARKQGGIEPGAGRGTYLVIWTTTPWTLMGNTAVAVHPDFEYAVCQAGPNEEWVVAADLPPHSARALGWEKKSLNIKRTLRGRELEGWAYEHPLGIRQGRVVLADYVTREDGTGLVHTAPGFGAEDYLTGKKYGLEVLAPVDSQGRFAGLPKAAERFNGCQVQETNPAVIEELRELGALAAPAAQVEHDYPHCWRCHTPIIFRATDQWFLRVEHQGLREKLARVIASSVQWIPPEGRERILGMVKTRPDWCLSRQRLWGIPVPALECVSCGEGLLHPEVIERFAAAIGSDPEGSDRWFTEPVSRWLPQGLACSKCKRREFKAGRDILDVWFDSGVSHEAVLARREGLSRPADLYLEGSDQHRGWFQVSLITAVALNGQAPYRGVLTHGFVVDGQGRKMSKSLGNVMAPQEVVSSLGADVLRLWAASSDYREDIRLSPVILNQAAEVYRKIRNTLRFALSNLSDFNPSDLVPFERMEGLDRWLMIQLRRVTEEATRDYETFSFHKVVKAIHEFCTVTLSNFYLDVVKDCLYTEASADSKRRSVQSALWRASETLLLLLAPLIPMTAEEAWGALPGKGESIHLQDWPDPKNLPEDPNLERQWQRLLALRDQAMKALEEARSQGLIGDSLQARLTLKVEEEGLWDFLKGREEDLKLACLVSDLRLVKEKGLGAPCRMEIAKAEGTKCQRCWRYEATVGSSKAHPGLCRRCLTVVEKLLCGGSTG
ncbi:MAG: isoleucine--tRNA ligase [Candidatus Omnitrophica bacterium]|nr:isoleucine--tRNA ligase [Candidatus Omnitrophota bacterium]